MLISSAVPETTISLLSVNNTPEPLAKGKFIENIFFQTLFPILLTFVRTAYLPTKVSIPPTNRKSPWSVWSKFLLYQSLETP